MSNYNQFNMYGGVIKTVSRRWFSTWASWPLPLFSAVAPNSADSGRCFIQ